MKMIVNARFFGGGKYSAPEIEMYSMPVENGFQSSPTTTLNYGENNYAGSGFIGEDGGDGYNDLGSF